MIYERMTNLDDPLRPWRRVYRTPTGVFAKVYAQRKPGALGKIVWEITGSACDENGSGAGDAVLGGRDNPQRHLLQVGCDRDPADAEPLADVLEREVLIMVARVERAVLNERSAQAL